MCLTKTWLLMHLLLLTIITCCYECYWNRHPSSLHHLSIASQFSLVSAFTTIEIISVFDFMLCGAGQDIKVLRRAVWKQYCRVSLTILWCCSTLIGLPFKSNTPHTKKSIQSSYLTPLLLFWDQNQKWSKWRIVPLNKPILVKS